MIAYGIGSAGCRGEPNAVVSYLDDAELQYEGEVQKANIIDALNDALHFPPDILRAKRYADYEGNEHVWDLHAVIVHHFVPSSERKTLGHRFYQDITSEEGRKKVSEILETLE
jgi:hypothetical protein